ncbi:MAG: hypothetical protein WEB58_02235 [Planctomycetaceae bacterium]
MRYTLSLTRAYAIVPITSVVAAALFLFAPLAIAIELNDVTEAVAEHERALQRVSFTMRIEGSRPTGDDSGEMFDFVHTQHVISEFGGRLLVELSGPKLKTLNGVRKEIETMAKGTYDGTEARFEFGFEKPLEVLEGVIDRNRNSIPFDIDPLEILTHRDHKPVSTILQTPGCSIVTPETYDGYDVIVIETAVAEREQNFKGRFYIAPKLGFYVVRKATLIQFPMHDWIEFNKVECADFIEVEPGIWLPQRAIIESTVPTEENARENTQPPLAWRFKVSNSDWVLNPEVSDTTFKMSFSDGIFVEDKIAGTTFRQAAITDEAVTRQVASPHPPQAESRDTFIVANLIVVGVLAVGFSIYWLKFR